MNRKAVTLTALLLGFGCSHAIPKSDPPAVAAAAPRAAPARVAPEHSNDTVAAQAPTRDDSAGNAIYFDFNSANLREDARPILQRLGKELAHAKKSIRIEGNCDERGTTEYNIALGDKRAREAKTYLERLGVPANHIRVVSYGSERPKYQGHDETAYAKNRRDDLVVR
jgi:peptidoglycan-associated lipoprotein